MTAICNKCRCKDVCGIKTLYAITANEAKEAYTPEHESFEVTIRCNAYIPDKRKEDANVYKPNRN